MAATLNATIPKTNKDKETELSFGTNPIEVGVSRDKSEYEGSSVGAGKYFIFYGRPSNTGTILSPDKDVANEFKPVGFSKYKQYSFGSESKREKEHSLPFLRAIRPHYMKDILLSLEGILPYAGTSEATMYVDTILQTIRTMEDTIPDDNIMRILRALYDALACNMQWITFNLEQYKEALAIIELNSKTFPLSAGEIEKAVLALERIGFNTTPYEFEIPEENID